MVVTKVTGFKFWGTTNVKIKTEVISEVILYG